MAREDANAGAEGEGPEESGDAALRPGAAVGNYRVVRCVAAGLLANYYHVQHVRDLHEMTVAVLHPRTMTDGDCLNRIRKLADTMGDLNHGGIPILRNCSEIDGRHCLFFDPLAKQKSLSAYFREHSGEEGGGIGPGKTARITASLLSVLGVAHSLGVDHRDLDTDLIFVDEEGGVEILGLGLKAALGRGVFEQIVSASVSPLVSDKRPDRMNSFDVLSNEYKSGMEEDWRVDISMVGVVAYWLLTGIKVKGNKWTPPSRFLPELSGKWDSFFKQSLERERDRRYQSCRGALFGLQATEKQEDSEQSNFIRKQIDRPPVPKGIRERGEVATRVYRLSMLGLIGITLVALMGAFVSSVFTESGSGESAPVAARADGGKAPDFRLRSDPPAAQLEFEEHGESFVYYEGLLELDVRNGDHKVRIHAPGYGEERRTIRIEEDATVEWEVTLDSELSGRTIVSAPGAEVFAVSAEGESIPLGQTNGDGRFTFAGGALPREKFALEVRKEGYGAAVVARSEVVSAEGPLRVALDPLPAVMEIRAAPEGVRIRMDGEDLGKAPVRLEDPETDGPITLRASLEGYRPEKQEVSVRPGEDVVVDFGELEPRRGRVEWELDFATVGGAEEDELLSEVRVLMDGGEYPLDADIFGRLPPGAHTVRFRHPLYLSGERDFTVEDGETKTVGATLTPRPATLKVALPDGLEAAIRVDGEEVDWPEGEGSLPAGERSEVAVEIPEHMIVRHSFTPEPAEEIEWEVEPVPIPAPEKGDDYTVPYLGIDLVWIEPGSFTMGSPPEEAARLPDEGPETEVTLTEGFWMGATEVTQAEYEALAEENPSAFLGSDRPVESVTWKEVRRYCRLLMEKEREGGRLPEGYVYRLPTEAEWAYAARAGTRTPFSFGSEADPTMGNFRGTYPRGREWVSETNTYGTLPVASFQPNGFGLYDVHGNVAEWTLDRFNGRLPGGRLRDPAPRREGSEVAIRGGSWKDLAPRVRGAARDGVNPNLKRDSVGFRIILGPEK